MIGLDQFGRVHKIQGDNPRDYLRTVFSIVKPMYSTDDSKTVKIIGYIVRKDREDQVNELYIRLYSPWSLDVTSKRAERV